uniref:SRCR domain-containing protein n=2 Tax=Cercopithecinae TaxID=9528 RepID=A0A2K5XLP3_MANLE
MVTIEQENTPTSNPATTEEEKTEAIQEVATPEHYIKHPLQNRWALWFFLNDKSKTWQANLWLTSEFDTLSHNLMAGCDYSLFKGGIEPMCDLDHFWLETLLRLIGESFDDYSNDVCGAVINVRAKGDNIAVWTTECDKRKAVTHIGRVCKKRLGLPPKIVIGCQSHADRATKSHSTTKNRLLFK